MLFLDFGGFTTKLAMLKLDDDGLVLFSLLVVTMLVLVLFSDEAVEVI